MIITDRVHLVSTESEAELHEFTQRIGLKLRWFQCGRHPHYDITTRNAYLKARAAGALLVTNVELFKDAWWAK